jgi:hypothetical protein
MAVFPLVEPEELVDRSVLGLQSDRDDLRWLALATAL